MRVMASCESQERSEDPCWSTEQRMVLEQKTSAWSTGSLRIIQTPEVDINCFAVSAKTKSQSKERQQSVVLLLLCGATFLKI